jgi:hypothetical protein
MSRWDENAMRHRWQWVLGLVALALTGTMASGVLAQNNPLSQVPRNPPRSFQENAPGARILPPGVVTPQTRIDQFETSARDLQAKQGQPIERSHSCQILGTDAAEFDALAHYSILILTVVTQATEELPLKRVYLRMPDREIPLLKIASWRMDVAPTLVTYKMFGPYREDGFYLFPVSAILRVAQLQIDLAANRSGLPLLEFPFQLGPNFLTTMQNPDPLPGALPNVKALQAFIKKRTSGYPIPTFLPQLPEAVPQPNEAKKNDKAATSSSR